MYWDADYLLQTTYQELKSAGDVDYLFQTTYQELKSAH